jgi:hypothetical protein
MDGSLYFRKIETGDILMRMEQEKEIMRGNYYR